jgi:hypothetical protein
MEPDPNKPILEWLTATVTADEVTPKQRIDAAQIVLFHHAKFRVRGSAEPKETQEIKAHLREMAMNEALSTDERIRAAMMVL